MNKYKKLLSILLVCNIGIISITGCGKSNISSNNTNTSDNIAVNTNNTASIQTNHTQIELDDEDLIDSYNKDTEYSCAMKSHFRKSGNQMTGKWKSSYASLLA